MIDLRREGAVFVLTMDDGENRFRPERVARWNEARHVRIHGVALGQDSTLLRWLAEDTGGRYARVD